MESQDLGGEDTVSNTLVLNANCHRKNILVYSITDLLTTKAIVISLV